MHYFRALLVPAVVVALIALGGCSAFSGNTLESVPLYVNLGASVLQTELQADLSQQTDAELLSRKHIMSAAVNPALSRIEDLGVAYEVAIDLEIQRRADTLPE